MKAFGDMTDVEFRRAEKAADLELWSGYAVFARALAGYNVYMNGVSVPKYILYNRHKLYPRQLEQIIDGSHPMYYKKINQNFDEALWTFQESELASQQGIDLTSLRTPSNSSTALPHRK